MRSLAAVGDGCPDVLCGYHGRNVLLEVKDGRKAPSARKLTPAEQEFHASWRGEVHVVTTIDEALQIIGKVTP